MDLSDQDYSMQLSLLWEEREELQWLVDHLTAWSSKTLMTEIVVESDASTHGWGATCDGVRIGRPWYPDESQWHIKCLEALAAFHAVRCFFRDRRDQRRFSAIEVGQYLSHLLHKQARCDSLPETKPHRQRPMAMVHEQGDNPKCRAPPGSAEHCSQQEISSDEGPLGLDAPPSGIPPDPAALGQLAVDLFASRLTTKLQRFFSWRPHPEVEALVAFSQDWIQLQGKTYGNHSGNKVCQQKITLVLVAPVWKSQPWYPMLLESGTPWLTFQISSHLQPDHPDTPRECPGDDAPTSSCLAYLRRRYQHKEISQEGAELLLASWGLPLHKVDHSV